MFTREDCSKNLQIKDRSSSCRRWSLYGFQTLHFICDQFGCKLWLLSIQNHAWHRFQAFACRPGHLKSLRCSISNLSRRPFLGQLFDTDLLLCTGIEFRFGGRIQRPSSWGRSPALLARVGQASTNTGRFRVSSSRCGLQPARLKKTCHHSCDTDSVQDSTRF